MTRAYDTVAMALEEMRRGNSLPDALGIVELQWTLGMAALSLLIPLAGVPRIHQGRIPVFQHSQERLSDCTAAATHAVTARLDAKDDVANGRVIDDLGPNELIDTAVVALEQTAMARKVLDCHLGGYHVRSEAPDLSGLAALYLSLVHSSEYPSI